MHNRIILRLQLLAQRWHRLNLSKQYMIANAVVLLLSMLVIGNWVAKEIGDGVSQFAASSTALYMNSLVAPLVQELTTQDSLSESAHAKLGELLDNTVIGKRILSFKIWTHSGIIAYSSHPSIIGKRFVVTPNLKLAWQGNVTAKFDTLDDEETGLAGYINQPLLEMYTPIREEQTGRIIAVGEFYEDADPLQQQLLHTKLKSWAVVAAVTLTIFLLLSGIIGQGSRTIATQRDKLKERITQLSDLRRRVARASMRNTEINEHFLRRIGAELHDGPAQLLGLALLKLGTIRSTIQTTRPASPGGMHDIVPIEDALNEALQEIRDISSGLALPELEALTLAEVLHKAIDTQERRTQIKVQREIGELPERVGQSLNICFFRLIQESLNNAFRHAGVNTARVSANYKANAIEVLIEDPGPGFDINTVTLASDRLGLSGLRERIESLGGFFELQSTPQDGTQVSAYFFMMDLEI